MRAKEVATWIGTDGRGAPAAPTTNKRLADERICDLVESDDVAKELEEISSEYRSQDGTQCYFAFKSADDALIERAVEKARGGTQIEIDGVHAIQLEHKDRCYIHVWLVPGDIDQQFTVTVGACDRSKTLARILLKRPPG